MAAKRNRWLVSGVLVIALGAFLVLSILPIFGGRNPTGAPTGSTPDGASGATEAEAELRARARGYELVLEREPENQTAILGLVDTLIQLGDLEAVVEPLGKLAELNPDMTEYQVLLGQTKQAIGDLEGAAQAYRAVLTTQPGDLNALQGLVALLLEQDRPQAAVGLLQDTLATAAQTEGETTPEATPIDTVSVRLLLAEVYVQQAQFEEALGLYDEAIALAAEDFRPLLAKALVLRNLDREAEAAPLFAQAEAIAPTQFKDQVRQLAANSSTPTTAPPEAPAAPGTDSEAAPGAE